MTKGNNLTQFDGECVEMNEVVWKCIDFFDPLDSMHAYARVKENNFSFFIMGGIT